MKVRSGPLLLLLGLGHSVNWSTGCIIASKGGSGFRKVMLGNALQICTCSIT